MDSAVVVLRCAGTKLDGNLCTKTTQMAVGPDFPLSYRWYCDKHRDANVKRVWR